MKNKFTHLILALIANFSFANIAYCHPLMNDVDSSEIYSESYVDVEATAPSFDCDMPCYEVPTPDFNCDVSSAYRYVSVGVGPIIFIPNVGIGYRERFSKCGWDTGLSFSTIGYAHQLCAHIVGHYYLSPSQKNSAYLGLGLMGSGVTTNHGEGGGTLSPDFVFGKELNKQGNSKHFIEMHVAIPTLWVGKKHMDSMHFPLMYIKYAFSF